jgi:MFS family permease
MFAVGYGTNHFAPLLGIYRQQLGLTDAAATAVFGVYAMGVIPGLLVAGPASDRRGRRSLLIAFTALSLIASVVLITGRWGVGGLYAGRLLTGVASGAVFSIGTAWVKELSEGAPAGAGARRGALALTAGIGLGPLVAGVLGQWGPEPAVLPYLLHLLLGGAALALLPRAPETVVSRVGEPRRTRQVLVPSARARRFTRVVVPIGPWVFGSLTFVFTTLPPHAAGPVWGLEVAFSGLLAALALGAGIAVQPLARRLHDASATGGTARAGSAGLALVTAGCLASAAATARPGAVVVTVAAVLLGAGYGLCIVAGLREVEELAPSHELGTLVALFYSLAYAGLLIQYLVALAADRVGYPVALLLTGFAAALTLAWVLVQGRRHPLRTAPA